MTLSVHVSTAARLHFGLLSFGQSDGQVDRRQYGGAGVMIKQPRVELKVTPSDSFRTSGMAADRVAEFARGWATHRNVTLSCAIEVIAAIPAHAGLGSGTQLGLAVAKALESFFEQPSVSVAELAASVGRGARSAVGSYGFEKGGFIAEHGKLPDESLGTLSMRCELPAEWRVVLFQQPSTTGLSGAAERVAFDSELPAIPAAITAKMTMLLADQIVPAAQNGDLAKFGSAVHDYGLLAGNTFAAVQGGAFASSEAEALAKEMRLALIHGVGQSSWGPTLFGFVESEAAARQAISQLKERVTDGGWEPRIVEVENQGALVQTTLS